MTPTKGIEQLFNKPTGIARVAAVVLSVVLALAGLAAGSAQADPAGTGPAKFMLVGGTQTKQISILRVHRDGRLSPIRIVPTGFGVLSLRLAHDGRTVYVGHAFESAVTVYHLTDSGDLVTVQRVNVNGPPVTLIPSPDNRYLWVATGGLPGHISTYAMSRSGALRKVGGDVPVGSASVAPMISVDPDGRFVRVASYADNAIESFAVGAQGSLRSIGRVGTGHGPVNQGTTPDGRFVYVAHEQSGDIWGYRVGPDGRLAHLPHGPWVSGAISHQVTITPDGRRAYVPNAGAGSVTGWTVGQDGSLTPLPGSPFATGGVMPALVVLNPNGHVLYAVDVMSPTQLTVRVHIFTIAPNGSLVKSGEADTGLLQADGPVAQITA